MTKKHFIEFAQYIKNFPAQNEQERKNMAQMVIDIAKRDNPKFDEVRFLAACEPK